MNVHMCDCHTLPCHEASIPYCCPKAAPGYIAEPYHIPGYAGHIPGMRTFRFGTSFGRLSRKIIEDPCVAQAPIPVLASPCRSCAPDTVNRCDDSVYVPRSCSCAGDSCCPSSTVYRCCEPICSSYSGHVPGLTFHSLGRTNARSTFGTGQYLKDCFYNNTHSVI